MDQPADNFQENKEFLLSYRRALSKRQRLIERLESLNSDIRSVKSQQLHLVSSKGAAPVTLDDLLIRKEELASRVAEEAKQCTTIRRKIERVITDLDDADEMDVLLERFVDLREFSTIAERMMRDERTITRWYASGVRNIVMKG